MNSFMAYDFRISDILLAGIVRAGEGTPVHTNRRGHGLVLYVDGKSCFHFGDRTLCAQKNDVIYLPKGSSYTVESEKTEKSIRCYAINFDLSESTDFPPFVIHTKNASALLSLFAQSEQAFRTKRSGYQMECRANLYHIICALRREFEQGYISHGTAGKIEPAIAYIHQNYTGNNINIAHLADLCQISETYFRAVFKKAMGCSPLSYINALKIERAKELLSSHLYTSADVAFLAGYHDECYFSREFKRATGISPSKYAEQ